MLWTECLCPPSFYVAALTPQCNCIRSWGLWEVLGWSPYDGISVLIRRAGGSSPSNIYEDKTRWWPSANQQEANLETVMSEVREEAKQRHSTVQRPCSRGIFLCFQARAWATGTEFLESCSKCNHRDIQGQVLHDLLGQSNDCRFSSGVR